MFVNVDEFNSAIRAWARDKPPEEVRKMTRVLAFKALHGVVMSTPVDLGDARFNWQTQLGDGDRSKLTGPFSGTDGGILGQGDIAAMLAISRGAAIISSMPMFGTITIFNNLPYIEVLEEGGFEPPNPGPSHDPRPWRKGRVWVIGGYSVQAPDGMVMTTVRDLRSIFP